VRAFLLGLMVVSLVACGGGSTAQSDAAVALDATPGDGGAADAPGDDGAPDALPSDGPPASPSLPEPLPDPLPSGAPAATVATYNTALAATIRGGLQRLPYVIDGLKQLDADVVCLEEVWTQYTTPEALAAEVASTFPYAFWHETGSTPMGAGTLILSRHPLYRGRVHVYATQEPGDYFAKNVLGVQVVTESTHYAVMCTHLAAPTDETGPVLRAAQIDELNAFATAQGYLAGPVYLLGDLNTGPDPVQACTPTTTPACLPPDVTSLAKLTETYTDPNVDWQQCTWCRDVAMPLQISASFGADADGRIDHCLYKGLAPVTFQSRTLLFDQTVSIPMGSVTLEHLSDHFGVRCVFAE
jgi:endonuclease/exonuclease/phosphatase family metal-dependent hydrolase